MASLVSSLTARSQLALKFMTILVQRDAGEADPDEVVARSYRLADSFLAVAREDWRDQRAKKPAASVDAADAADEYEAADNATMQPAA